MLGMSDMRISYRRAVALLTSQLTRDERGHGVAYIAETPVAAGTTLTFARLKIPVAWDAYVGFVDREPRANWSHACRYVLIRTDGGEVQSIEAQFPPFAESRELTWRVAYRAPSVPESLLAVPE
jgi:hypothetical protein